MSWWPQWGAGSPPGRPSVAPAAWRAGNSVQVLLARYVKCLDGRQDVANRRIEDLLREYE